MSAQVGAVKDGILTLMVSGTLTQSELAEVQQTAADIIRAQGKVRLLVLAGDFAGWERDGEWDDFSFQEAFDPYIEKMAIVGEKKWEEQALVFSANMVRQFPIQYFQPHEIDLAKAWLVAD